MQIEYMQEFLVTADIGSFTKAADAIFTTQPVLSKHIRDLEETLGGRLFDRSSKKRLKLTPLGQVAYESFQGIVQSYDQLLYDAKRINNDNATTIRITSLSMTASNCIIPFIETFQLKNPDVKFVYKTEKPDEIIEDLIVGSTDIGLLTETDYDDRDLLEYTLLGESTFYFVLSAESFDENVRSITVKDLAERPLICLSSKETTRAMNRKMLTIGYNPSKLYYVDELDIAAAQVVREDGCFAIPGFLIPRFSAYSNIRIVPLEPRISINVFFAKKKTNVNPVVIQFLDVVDKLTSITPFSVDP